MAQDTYPTTSYRLGSTARIAAHPIHPILVPVPIVCFVGALFTDIVYTQTATMMWSDFSAWLITVGVIVGWLAALFGAIDLLANRAVRSLSVAWMHGIGNLVVLALATVNMLVHTHDAWTSVVPWGITLSALTVLILLVTGWLGWSLVYRYRVGGAR
jgi:uncharacterized membrane protein